MRCFTLCLQCISWIVWPALVPYVNHAWHIVTALHLTVEPHRLVPHWSIHRWYTLQWSQSVACHQALMFPSKVCAELIVREYLFPSSLPESLSTTHHLIGTLKWADGQVWAINPYLVLLNAIATEPEQGMGDHISGADCRSLANTGRIYDLLMFDLWQYKDDIWHAVTNTW